MRCFAGNIKTMMDVATCYVTFRPLWLIWCTQVREQKLKLFRICTLWCSSPYQLQSKWAGMAVPGYHADCGDIAHGSCCGKMTFPWPSLEWHFALYRPSWCSCNVLWRRKGRTGGRGWLLHQDDKAWPCVSSVVEGPWLAPGGVLLSTNRLRKLFSHLVGPTYVTCSA